MRQRLLQKRWRSHEEHPATMPRTGCAELFNRQYHGIVNNASCNLWRTNPPQCSIHMLRANSCDNRRSVRPQFVERFDKSLGITHQRLLGAHYGFRSPRRAGCAKQNISHDGTSFCKATRLQKERPSADRPPVRCRRPISHAWQRPWRPSRKGARRETPSI